MELYLRADPKNVVAIHCKAGKVSLLIYHFSYEQKSKKAETGTNSRVGPVRLPVVSSSD